MFFRTVLVIVFCVGFIGCTEPNEFFDNDGAYTVITYGKVPIDYYLEKDEIVLQYLAIDKNEKANKIFINTWGEFTVTKINEENTSIFELAEKHYSAQTIMIYNIKILGDTLEGTCLHSGDFIYTVPVDFMAVRGICNCSGICSCKKY